MVRRLLTLNGLAVIAVVLNHAAGWGFTAMFWWTDRYLPVTVPNFDQMGSVSYYALSVAKQMSIFAVPAFLLVSGFFISFAAGRSQNTVSWRVIGSRIKFLVIPYLLWSILILCVEFIEGKRYSTLQYLEILVTGKAAPPYYYVPLLVQLLLLSPLIVPIARHRWKYLLLTTGMIMLAVRGLRYPYLIGADVPGIETFIRLTPPWFFPNQIFWFAFGIVIGFHIQSLKQFLVRIKWELLVATVILVPIGVYEWQVILDLSAQDWLGPVMTIVDDFYAGALILSFIAFDKISYPMSRQINELGGKSYGIYLVHAIVLAYTARVLYHLAPGVLAYQALFQTILVLLALSVPLLLMKAMRMPIARRFYAYSFG